jgi:hypothetical protein
MFDVESTAPELWKEIKELEQREAEAMLRADVSTLRSLWSDDLVVNSTANLIADKNMLLGMINDGLLRLKLYSRLTLRAAAAADVVVATGNETSRLAGPASQLLLYCSYMNTWIRRADGWELIGRHVGLIARGRSGSTGGEDA